MDVIVNDNQIDPKAKMAEEIEDTLHDAGRISRTAVMSDDISVKKSLRAAVKTLVDTAVAKLDESIGASIADDEDE
jgi:hypothetical protein